VSLRSLTRCRVRQR